MPRSLIADSKKPFAQILFSYSHSYRGLADYWLVRIQHPVFSTRISAHTLAARIKQFIDHN